MEHKMKHLEMIQGIITRMGGNSFMLKGWTVTLMTGIFVLADKSGSKLYFLGALIPLLVFWGLDAFYLRQERLYRKLYDYVRMQEPGRVDFSMSTAMPELHSRTTRYGNSLCSLTELGFYLPLLILYLVLAFFSSTGWL